MLRATTYGHFHCAPFAFMADRSCGRERSTFDFTSPLFFFSPFSSLYDDTIFYQIKLIYCLDCTSFFCFLIERFIQSRGGFDWYHYLSFWENVINWDRLAVAERRAVIEEPSRVIAIDQCEQDADPPTFTLGLVNSPNFPVSFYGLYGFTVHIVSRVDKVVLQTRRPFQTSFKYLEKLNIHQHQITNGTVTRCFRKETHQQQKKPGGRNSLAKEKGFFCWKWLKKCICMHTVSTVHRSINMSVSVKETGRKSRQCPNNLKVWWNWPNARNHFKRGEGIFWPVR